MKSLFTLKRATKFALLVLAALVLSVSAQATGVQYSVTVLGLVQHNYPSSYFNPEAINDSNVIAGNAVVRVPLNPLQSERGVLWHPSTQTTRFWERYRSILVSIVMPPASITMGLQQATPGSMSPAPSSVHPVMFTANGTVNLGVKNSSAGWATGINNSSQVVGYLDFETPVPGTEAFLYQN